MLADAAMVNKPQSVLGCSRDQLALLQCWAFDTLGLEDLLKAGVQERNVLGHSDMFWNVLSCVTTEVFLAPAA
jgi:hypothetical protein